MGEEDLLSGGKANDRLDPVDLEALLAQVDRFVRERLEPKAADIDAAGVFPTDLYKEFGSLGIFGLFAPQSYGGLGEDLRAACLITERLAKECLSFAISVSNCADCIAPIVQAGRQKVLDSILPGILAGELIPAFCLSEASGGSDVVAMKMHATKVNGGYRLEGEKTWITSATAADVYIMFAKTDATAGHKGLSAFVVPRTAENLTIGAAEALLGLRASPVATVTCTGTFVPDDFLLGSEGDGFKLAMSAMDHARVVIASCALGAAGKAVETAVEYARTRQQFGKPIIEHQGLGFILADLVAELAESRAFVANAIIEVEEGSPQRAGLYAAMAKKTASDFAMRAAIDAAQVLGANGLSKAYPVERLIRDCKALQIFEGTNQIQQWIIARQLAKNGISLTGLAELLA